MVHRCVTSPVWSVWLASCNQTNQTDRPNRPHEQDGLADFFSILLESKEGRT
jgi:hypothetical protein